jgi:YHS domain-containing protein
MFEPVRDSNPTKYVLMIKCFNYNKFYNSCKVADNWFLHCFIILSSKEIMKKFILIFTSFLILGVATWFLFFKEPTFKATNGFLVNLDSKGVIIEGYDPVAYFTDNKPVKGSEQFKTEFDGATYWFVSADHADLFKKDPKKYAPQYGAFCGYAVSIGKLRPVDPLIYQIEDSRLILQHTQEAYRLFNKNLKESTEKADKNWPGLVENHVGKPVQYDKPAAPASASSQ